MQDTYDKREEEYEEELNVLAEERISISVAKIDARQPDFQYASRREEDSTGWEQERNIHGLCS